MGSFVRRVKDDALVPDLFSSLKLELFWNVMPSIFRELTCSMLSIGVKLVTNFTPLLKTQFFAHRDTKWHRIF